MKLLADFNIIRVWNFVFPSN